MSWSAMWKVNKDLVTTTQPTVSSADKSEEAWEQYVAAVGAVTELLTSDSVGDNEKTYMINMVGHANPNHEPALGFANDFISITVTQVNE